MKNPAKMSGEFEFIPTPMKKITKILKIFLTKNMKKLYRKKDNF